MHSTLCAVGQLSCEKPSEESMRVGLEYSTARQGLNSLTPFCNEPLLEFLCC